MATERQIAANRLNARKSTGPRSIAAKERASRNAYRHGLTLSLPSDAGTAKRLDEFARKLAGDSKNELSSSTRAPQRKPNSISPAFGKSKWL